MSDFIKKLAYWENNIKLAEEDSDADFDPKKYIFDQHAMDSGSFSPMKDWKSSLRRWVKDTYDNLSLCRGALINRFQEEINNIDNNKSFFEKIPGLGGDYSKVQDALRDYSSKYVSCIDQIITCARETYKSNNINDLNLKQNKIGDLFSNFTDLIELNFTPFYNSLPENIKKILKETIIQMIWLINHNIGKSYMDLSRILREYNLAVSREKKVREYYDKMRQEERGSRGESGAEQSGTERGFRPPPKMPYNR